MSDAGRSDRDEHLGVQATASFIIEHHDCFPGGKVPAGPSQLAILAIKVYDVFLISGEASDNSSSMSDAEITAAIVDTVKKYDAMLPDNVYYHNINEEKT